MSEIIASTYELIEKIGAGGGGVVYLANHLRLNKLVILKADKRKITTRPDLLRREVDVLKDLSNPYIPQVYDFFVENDVVYTAMDFIEGESLDRPLKRGEHYPQPPVIKWARQLLEALEYLHSPIHGNPPRGYVHSDIKPANLMRKPDNDICLIDFNIALALGEENVIGCSAGYASPEHYGLDFSTDDETKTKKSKPEGNGETQLMPGSSGAPTVTKPVNSASGTVRMKTVLPDVRSDIYSVGATLYHLLCGVRPARNAREVLPLSKEEFSPQVVAIISKAMNPNPNLRYQTAQEMLNAFRRLHENDPRTRRLKRSQKVCAALLSAMLLTGVTASFIGLKRMQATEQFLKLAEYSRNACTEGDLDTAIAYALQAIPERTAILTPESPTEAQRALTEALGVYDLSDGFKSHGTVELPAAPLCMRISPDGRTACTICASSLEIFDTDTGEIRAELSAETSALSEAEFLNNQVILYAGEDALQAYDIEAEKMLWSGAPATSVCISGDGKRAAAVYKEETEATIYDTASGQILYKVDFKGRHQRVTVNDIFANPNDNLFALNQDGTLLGVSFSDGSLMVCDLEHPGEDLEILGAASGYTHFEGGFYEKYFAFSVSTPSESAFAVVDMERQAQTGGFESDGTAYSVQTDDTGIYVQNENLLVRIHPETGEQTPLVATSENIQSYARSESHTLITSENEFLFFDQHAGLTSRYEKEYQSDFLQIAEGTALIGSSDSPVLRIMQYENYPDAELFCYDPLYDHDEARISGDGKTVMLFSYDEFRLYDMSGTLLTEVEIPDAAQVYDQQYIRDEEGSRLEVIYNDGTITAYSAADGVLLYEKKGESPNKDMYEEFFTDTLRIESPLHGTPTAYDRSSGRLIRELEKDTYLTYVTPSGPYLVAQFITTDGYGYGQLLNHRCEVLAELPYLSDVLGDRLIFDYPTGDLRESRIYEVEELVDLAQNRKNEGERE